MQILGSVAAQSSAIRVRSQPTQSFVFHAKSHHHIINQISRTRCHGLGLDLDELVEFEVHHRVLEATEVWHAV
jgi:hypothetical protein